MLHKVQPVCLESIIHADTQNASSCHHQAAGQQQISLDKQHGQLKMPATDAAITYQCTVHTHCVAHRQWSWRDNLYHILCTQTSCMIIRHEESVRILQDHCCCPGSMFIRYSLKLRCSQVDSMQQPAVLLCCWQLGTALIAKKVLQAYSLICYFVRVGTGRCPVLSDTRCCQHLLPLLDPERITYEVCDRDVDLHVGARQHAPSFRARHVVKLARPAALPLAACPGAVRSK